MHYLYGFVQMTVLPLKKVKQRPLEEICASQVT